MRKGFVRVLVADDDEEDAWLVSYALIHHGYTVEIAGGADDAVAKARANPPDLLVLDILMPGKNGIEAANEIRSDRRFHDLPVIFVTGLVNGHALPGDGPGAVLSKPLCVTLLVEAAERLLEGAQEVPFD